MMFDATSPEASFQVSILVLVGGRALRMGQIRKGSLRYQEKGPHWIETLRIAQQAIWRSPNATLSFELKNLISVHPSQILDLKKEWDVWGNQDEELTYVVDDPLSTVLPRSPDDIRAGPLWGIRCAMMHLSQQSGPKPDGLLVLACDLPLINEAELVRLLCWDDEFLKPRALCSPDETEAGGPDKPEPLIALWPLSMRSLIERTFQNWSSDCDHGIKDWSRPPCPRSFLIRNGHLSVPASSATPLTNANTLEDKVRFGGRHVHEAH